MSKMAKRKPKPNLITKAICCFFCIWIASDALAATTEVRASVAEVAKDDCTDLARDEETLMVFSTLGGGLTAIDPITSEIRWTIADDPPIKSEQQPPQSDVQVPQYLPDPRDGSIYQLGDMGDLKKLPYTIPQLVASAPCRSSDGILYSGKKSDTWFMIDPKTGRREKVMGFGGSGDSCSATDNDKIGWATSRAIYLGRTQYTVMMYDSLSRNKNAKPWNITFYDYSAHSITPDITKEYEYIHLTTTSNGNIVTLDRKDGKFIWQRDLTSPVVAAFLLGSEGLLSVPFTTVSDKAFEAILEESKTGNVNTVKLFQSLYVGEHQHGLYALPSLVDRHTPRISTFPPKRLLVGPNTNGEDIDPNTVYLNDVMRQRVGIVLGHYSPPKDDHNLQISPQRRDETTRAIATIRDFPDAKMGTHGYSVISTTNDQSTTASATVDIGSQRMPHAAFNKTKKIIIANRNKIQKFFNEWFMDHPSGQVHQILILLVLAMVAMFWYFCSTMRELKQQSENGSKTSASGGKGTHGSQDAQDTVDLGDGLIRVGKISFNSQEVLGKGCEGTFVFKGTFEERYVAVKRLLPECFTFADREVALLRESDAHENVVRYFCTEQDRQFRYIAVELCAATLQDYTEGESAAELRQQIDVWAVLRQAAAGLSHLHSLNIVHRDIKPQNVLLSLPDVNGAVRVMISDFGLCKKLHSGKTSFSRRSGVTGTDGWIAPEMMRGQRTTTSVDVFSLGCVYYYVLSGGGHAFGDTLKRQANILTNEFHLERLSEEPTLHPSRRVLAEQLIADMIRSDAQRRPPAKCIGNHPMFWADKKILAFLQDVSDRVEKLRFDVEPLKSLERNGRIVVLDDWHFHLDPLIIEDLRKYRGYMGASVRDLLRALRNKKHHYHELTPEMQAILGSVPHEFTDYWIRKFPHLISHAYHAFRICSEEAIFRPYYDGAFHFSRPEYFEADATLYPTLLDDSRPVGRPNGGQESPRKSPRTPEKPGHAKQRKGGYNFRRTSPEEGGGGVGVGLQRNLELPPDEENGGGALGVVRRDAFANFKFRHQSKSTAQRYHNQLNGGGKEQKEKNVTWTLANVRDNDES